MAGTGMCPGEIHSIKRPAGICEKEILRRERGQECV